MNKDSVIDYLSCILLRTLGGLIRTLPVAFSLFLGRRLGDILYFFDLKHRSIAYSNIRRAFGGKMGCHSLRQLTRAFYRSLGQNLLEIFFIPFIDKKYIEKYIQFEGREFIEEAFRAGRGVIFLGVHSGSWELSNVICANLGFSFNLLVRNQRYPRLNNLLNQYRRQKGCKIIQRQSQTRALVEALLKNESIGMTIDQGGKAGVCVDFFSSPASMSTGAVRLALKYNSVILPAYYTRLRGPYIKTIIMPPFQVKKSGHPEKDVHENVQELTRLFESCIDRYPKDYLWSYKIWKYGSRKNVLILSDEKAGHLRQSQAVAGMLKRLFEETGRTAQTETIELKFKNGWAQKAFVLASLFSGRYSCQGCLRCLQAFLRRECLDKLLKANPDIIISAGSRLGPVNYLVSRENNAKSIVLMRPSWLSVRRFHLAIIPRHDRPAQAKNVVITEGALNLIDENYLADQVQQLMRLPGMDLSALDLYLGLLIGGDTGSFQLTPGVITEVLAQVQSAAEQLNAQILATTSRRTAKAIEDLVKEKLGPDPRCKMLVVANEKNIPQAVGGIAGLSQFLICSPESISMISEACRSGKYVFVFKARGLSRKHQRFLDNFSEKQFIYWVEPGDLSRRIMQVWGSKPQAHVPSDNHLVQAALKRIL